MIEKITGLNGMKNLRILSVGRNYIKSFTGLVCIEKVKKLNRLKQIFDSKTGRSGRDA